MPGIPFLPFATLSAITGAIAWNVLKVKRLKEGAPAIPGGPPPPGVSARTGAAAAPGAPGAAAPTRTSDEQLADSLQIDSLRLELGYGLLPLINYQKGHRLTEQIKALRKQVARDLGFIIPPVRIQDNMQLPPNSYVIRIKEIECGRGSIRADSLLVMNPTGGKIQITGEETTEPTFGLPAMWIGENLREEALFKNYTVVDPPTVLTTHLTELVKENMPDLLSYVETQKLLDDLPKPQQKLVSDIIPSQISIGSVQRILQNLLAELVSIRDLPTIIEAIGEATAITKNITLITEHVRARLARQISAAHTTDSGYIPIVVLSPAWEQSFAESLTVQGEEKTLTMAPSKIQEFITSVRKKYDQFAMTGEIPVLLTSPSIRPYVRSIVERFRAATIIMSQNEIHPKAKIKTLGQI